MTDSNEASMVPQSPPVVESPAPVDVQERFVAVDVLRGFAVLGLMMVHIVVFSRPVDPSGDLTAGMPVEGANRAFLWIIHVLVSSKFMFLFALLFGAGVIFFGHKAKSDRLGDGAGLWYARMGWLAAIGLAHGIFLFFGDILFTYAIAGMGLLWWVRLCGPKLLLGIGAIFYGFGALVLIGVMWLALSFGGGESGGDAMNEMISAKAQMEAYRGTYLDSLWMRLLFMINNLALIPFVTFWLTSGIMLFGMALAKWGVLTGQRSARFYAILAVLGIGVGLPLAALLYQWAARGDFDMKHSLLFASYMQPVGIPLALGYLGLVMLIAKQQWLAPLRVSLAAVGRMALSNYLLHSLLGAFIFHGWGLGFFGELQFPTLFGIVLAIWAVNIIGSLLWLRWFRFGPAEWLWRSLTYMKMQPLRYGAVAVQPTGEASPM